MTTQTISTATSQSKEGGIEHIHKIMDDFKNSSASSSSSALSSFTDGLSANKEEPAKEEEEVKQEEELNLGEFMDADLVLELGNIAVSSLLLVSMRFMKKDVNKSEFLLNATEKKALKQPLANYLKTLDYESVSPASQLLIAVVVIYLGKLAPVFLSGSTQKGQVKTTKGRGRPPGSKNKKKEGGGDVSDL